MPPILLLIYFAGCLLCGYMGRKTTFGAVGHFWLAVFLTPILAFVIQAVGRQAKQALPEQPRRFEP